MIDIQDYDFAFPPELVAQRAAPKGESRILHCPRIGSERTVIAARQMVELFRPGDCLVVNNTKVIPARLLGRRESGAELELLLVAPLAHEAGRVVWEAWVRPGKHFRPGKVQRIGGVEVETLRVQEDGTRVVEFRCSAEEFRQLLEREGRVPLPPYIAREADAQDRADYQTVFAKHEGAVAAPTASLHFSESLLDELRARGVEIAEVTLHVGPGTFKPVETRDALQHVMHGEWYRIEAEAAERINRAKAAGGRIVSVGTTSTRVLETVADESGRLVAAEGVTRAYIYPGYRWKVVDGLLTNFHWPKSTLLLLVSALYGREQTLAAYQEAMAQRLRLFSYGDGMLIL